MASPGEFCPSKNEVVRYKGVSGSGVLCVESSESNKIKKKNLPRQDIDDTHGNLAIAKQHPLGRTVTVSDAGIFEVNGIYRFNGQSRTWDQEVSSCSSSSRRATGEYKIINIGFYDTEGTTICRWSMGLLPEGEEILGPRHKIYYEQFGSDIHELIPSDTRKWLTVPPVRKTSDLPTITLSPGCPCCGR